MAIRRNSVTSDTQMKAATGFSHCEFDALLPYFAQAHQMRKGPLEVRINNVKSFSFHTYEDFLFFVLYKLKTNLGYQLMGLTFGLSHSTAERLFKEGAKILELAQKLSGSAPAREAEDVNLDQETNYGIDATGFADERPCDYDKQRASYSWKHRCTEQKATIIADLEEAMIHFVGQLHEGSVHDKTMFERDFRRAKKQLSENKFFVDLAYQAVKVFCSQARFILPYKKPKGGELSQDQKRYNRMISPLRVRIEHAIRGFKRYGMFSQRNRTKDLSFFNVLVGVGAGLWNFKCQLRLGMQMPQIGLKTA